jgi:hypothetical protein
MQTLLASIVAAVAGIAGTLLGAEMHRRTAREAREDARREQRRQDFLAALDAFTGAVGNLLDAEYDRAKNAFSMIQKTRAPKPASAVTRCVHQRGMPSTA